MITMVKVALQGAFIGLLAALSWQDMKCRVLPNGLNLAVAMVGILRILVQGVNGMELRHLVAEEVIPCALGALFLGSVFLLFALIRPGSLGGGDIKMAAAGGLMLGLMKSLTALVFAFASAGLVMSLWTLVIRLSKNAPKPEKRKVTLPFGPFLALGLIVGFYCG